MSTLECSSLSHQSIVFVVAHALCVRRRCVPVFPLFEANAAGAVVKCACFFLCFLLFLPARRARLDAQWLWRIRIVAPGWAQR